MMNGGWNNRRPRSVVIGLVAIAASLAVAACGDSSSGGGQQAAGDGTADELRIALAPGSALDLAPWIAQEEGFFKDEGLDVQATIPTIPFSQLPSALGRDYDIIIGTQPDLITAASRGLDLVAVGGINMNSDTVPGAELVVPARSDVKSIADLATKSVGAPSLSGNNWLTLKCWADKEGVDPDSIRGVEAPAPQIPDLLRQGRFDAALLFEPLLGGVLAAGGRSLGNSYDACFDEPVFTSLWVAKGEWARQNGESIAAFLRGLTKAKQHMADNPDDARAMYVERSGLPKPVALKAPIDPSVFDFRPVTVEDLTPWLELMRSVSGFDGDIDLSELVVR
jgi:ABC-type nitrate/sulfonate/bicarbonate transport system substrate-binding protein